MFESYSNENKNKRFNVVYEQGTIPRYKIILDTLTGVNYLFTWEDNVGGLTVLLDGEGKPVVTPTD